MKKQFEINGKIFSTNTNSINPLKSLMEDSKTKLVSNEFVGLCAAPKKNDYFTKYLGEKQ